MIFLFIVAALMAVHTVRSYPLPFPYLTDLFLPQPTAHPIARFRHQTAVLALTGNGQGHQGRQTPANQSLVIFRGAVVIAV